jgi:hypothetical protein
MFTEGRSAKFRTGIIDFQQSSHIGGKKNSVTSNGRGGL